MKELGSYTGFCHTEYKNFLKNSIEKVFTHKIESQN